MKKKRASKRKRQASEPGIPDWLLDDSPIPNKPLSKQALDQLATGVESGIRDTAAWKDLVRRVGKKEAVRILKVGLFAKIGVLFDPNN